jgi:dipeptidyl aminopeptidase/acylaminoacyl peptidase
MLRILARLAAVMLAAACCSSQAGAQTIRASSDSATQAISSPTLGLTVDDVVAMESFGSVSIDPTGSWAVYERRGAFDSAPRYDLGFRSIWAVTDLWVMDVRHGVHPERLLSGPKSGGLLLGPWSPSGGQLIVYRLDGEHLEAGIVTISDRSVRWTGLTPDMPITGDFINWLDEGHVAMTVRPDGTLPWILRHDGDSQSETTRQWAQMSRGQRPSRTIVETRGGIATTENPLAPLDVVILDTGTLTVRTVAQGQIRDIATAPDGRKLAVLQAGEGVAAPPTGPIVQSDILERGLLAIVDTASGQAFSVVRDRDVGLNLLRWSPGSRSLLVWTRRPGALWSSGELTQIDAHGVAIDVIRQDLDPFVEGATLDGLTAVHADFIGEAPVLYGRKADADRFDWFRLSRTTAPVRLTAQLESVPSRLAAITDRSALMFGDGALWVTHADGLRRVSRPDVVLADASSGDLLKPVRLRVNDPPRRDWAVGKTSEGDVVLAGVDDGARLSDIPQGGMTRIVAASPSGLIALTTDRGEQTLRLGRGNDPVIIDRLNEALAQRRFPAALPIPHKDRLGRATTSFLFLPVGVEPGAVKGLVVMVYPGSVDDGAYQDPMTLMYGLSSELIASAGFAVLSPSIPLSGAGSDSIEGYVESVDAAVGAALLAYPGLPADRMTVLGHSYGGYAALAIATRSHRFRSYVSWAGASDLIGKWGEFTPISRSRPEEGATLMERMGWVEEGQGATRAPPWAAPERYVAMSPLFAADRITAPVMLISGDRDFVPLSQSESIFSALHRQSRQARLLTYWGEGHLMWSPANVRDVYAQLFNWWETTLTPAAGTTIAPPTSAPIPPSRPQP